MTETIDKDRLSRLIARMERKHEALDHVSELLRDGLEDVDLQLNELKTLAGIRDPDQPELPLAPGAAGPPPLEADWDTPGPGQTGAVLPTVPVADAASSFDRYVPAPGNA